MSYFYEAYLNAGFCSTDEYKVIKSDIPLESDDFEEMIIEHAEQYICLAHLRSVDEIMEEEGIDKDEAEEYFQSEYDEYLASAFECSCYKEITEAEYLNSSHTRVVW